MESLFVSSHRVLSHLHGTSEATLARGGALKWTCPYWSGNALHFPANDSKLRYFARQEGPISFGLSLVRTGQQDQRPFRKRSHLVKCQVLESPPLRWSRRFLPGQLYRASTIKHTQREDKYDSFVLLSISSLRVWWFIIGCMLRLFLCLRSVPGLLDMTLHSPWFGSTLCYGNENMQLKHYSPETHQDYLFDRQTSDGSLDRRVLKTLSGVFGKE